ncbi:MAG: hemerythrin domain-containing protein [Pseudomonadota bacterium]
MKHAAIRIIQDEHLAISAVLYCLRHQVRQMRDQAAAPNFALLHAIFDYIVSYPDRWHHPKEDRYLFARVRRRTHEADELLAELEREHELGHPLIEELKRSLVDFECARPDARDRFFAAAERYVRLEWEHMRKEEDLLLPIAERVLSAEDWQEILEAFRENDNPLFGLKPRDEANLLYRRILALFPEIKARSPAAT